MNLHSPIGPDPFVVVTQNPANPSAGANLSVDVNPNTRWQLLAIDFLLATDANAATRFIQVHGFNGTNNIYTTGPANAQTASITNHYFANVGQGNAYDLGVTTRPAFALNQQMFLDDNDDLRITITSIQVGDQISDIFITFKQWITEN